MSAERLRAVLLLALVLAACGREKPSGAAAGAAADLPAPAESSSGAACGHAACGSDYVVDSTPVGDCAAGAACAVALTLVTSGDYHINDEYPYRFKADEDPSVEFLGTDVAGKAVFSKAANDWTKPAEKTGRMTVSFKPRDAAVKSVSGVFKLSVCSIQNCRLEQARIRAAVAVK